MKQIDTVKNYIDDYIAKHQPYQSYWNYEDGVVLIGSLQLYEATGNKSYLDFVVSYVDKLIAADGTIKNYEGNTYNIDSINCGKVLFKVYEITKEERYKLALDFIMARLKEHPRTKSGNFWHKSIYPNQIWLDGLYMAQPFYMEYESKYNGKENYQDILSQFENVRKYLFNSEKKLYYHAFDEAKIQPWADKETGLSPNFWIRAMGWYLMALVDVIEAMDQQIFEDYRRFSQLLKEAVDGILAYQDSQTGLFFQVIDRADFKGNYLETSGSVMVAYTLLKACRLGVLSKEKYLPAGLLVFEGLLTYKFTEIDGRWHLIDICRVAGLGPGDKRDGSVEYYLSEEIVSDEAKAVGPFMMAYAQYLLTEKI